MGLNTAFSVERRALDLSRLCLAVTEYAPLPIAVVEAGSLLIRYANPAFCRLLNKPQTQIVGQVFSDLLPQKSQCLMLINRVLQTGLPENHTERAQSKRHAFFWSYSLWPVIVDDHPVGVFITITETVRLHESTLAMNEALVIGAVRQHELQETADSVNHQLEIEIKERKRIEEALRLAQAQLEDRAGQLEGLVAERTTELRATNEQLETFVYSIAHDLRAPLRSMQGFSTILVEEAGTSLNETSQDCIARISRSAVFMDSLLIDLLAFSRISQQRVELTAVDLKPVVDSVCARLRQDIELEQAKVESSGPWPKVMAHSPTLTQVLFNLVSNTLRFIETDVPPIIRIWPEDRGDLIRVWVEDNGPGIAPEYQTQIFGLFTRLEGSKYAGTGIGLAIVQKGIERMGGKVGVESALGQGCRFWFDLRKSE